jgi:hypothetical protein
MPETLMRDQLPMVGNCNCRARKGPLSDSGAQDIKGAVKLFVLPVTGR